LKATCVRWLRIGRGYDGEVGEGDGARKVC
jgi:hypothetical protein